MTKKILTLMLALVMILSMLCACSGNSEETDPSTGSKPEATEFPYNENNAALLTDCRIVYASGSKPIALQISYKLKELNPDGNYPLVKDTDKADDGSAEILVGLTNRAASAEAKAALEGDMDFSVIVSGKKVAIFANTDNRLKSAVEYFTSKLIASEDKEIFYPTKDKYIGKFSAEDTLPLKIDGVEISKFMIIVPKSANEVPLAIAEKLQTWIAEQTGTILVIENDEVAQGANEILIGKTNRAESTAIASVTFKNQADFKTSVSNGKLAIIAGAATGYTSALTSFINTANANNGDIKEAFAPKSLTFDEIKSITVGAVHYEEKNGALNFFMYTPDQMRDSGNSNNFKDSMSCTVGIRLDFETNSSSLYMKSSGTFVLYVDGKQTQILSGAQNFIELSKKDSDTSRVTIWFPCNGTGTISELQLDGGSTFTRHEFGYKMLLIGDSITHGWYSGIPAGGDADCWAPVLSRELDADTVIQGNGGTGFPGSPVPKEMGFDPDIILIALGTNDRSRFNSNATEYQGIVRKYLDEIKAEYPNAIVVGITPISRLDLNTDYDKNMFKKLQDTIEEEFLNHGFLVANGSEIVPAEERYFPVDKGDMIHPNKMGSSVYAENMIAFLAPYIEELQK